MAQITEYPLSRATWLVFATLLMALPGCGPGDGQGLNEEGDLLVDQGSNGTSGGGNNGGGNTPGASGNPNATLAWVQANVFGGVCTQCHTGAGAPLGVDWSTGSGTCSNIGRTSGEVPSLREIDAGNPAGSYVVWKLEGAGPNGEAIVGAQMPLSNPALGADTIQNIKDWIGDGSPGCGSSRPGTDPAAGKAAALADSSAYSAGSWLYVWEQSLRLCSTCHSPTPSNPSCVAEIECPPAGLVLDAENYYGLFDGRTVTPFDPQASLLWTRTSGDRQGPRMPLGYPPLTDTQQEIIRTWILDGAPLWPDANN